MAVKKPIKYGKQLFLILFRDMIPRWGLELTIPYVNKFRMSHNKDSVIN